jgi:hypothetical protein
LKRISSGSWSTAQQNYIEGIRSARDQTTTRWMAFLWVEARASPADRHSFWMDFVEVIAQKTAAAVVNE